MVVRISDKTQNYSKVTKLLVKPLSNKGKAYVYISKNPVIQHNLQFDEDYKIAEQIDKKLKRMALEKNRLD